MSLKVILVLNRHLIGISFKANKIKRSLNKICYNALAIEESAHVRAIHTLVAHLYT